MRRCGHLLPMVLVAAWWTVGSARASPTSQSPAEGEAVFREKCTACHTVGRGKLVGPDLMDVTTRRDRAWLLRWIREPDRMIAEGDPIALEQLAALGNVAMPNLGLAEREVEAVVAYLESLAAGRAGRPAGLPSFYLPTLIVSLLALGGLTAISLAAARKQVEMKP